MVDTVFSNLLTKGLLVIFPPGHCSSVVIIPKEFHGCAETATIVSVDTTL